jgi:death-on-curing protein
MTYGFGPASPAFLINIADVIRIHDDAIERFGGMPGLRDIRLLESAVNEPLNVISYGTNKDREVHYLAAVYCFHIIKNHAFNDGNKRAGLLTALTFLSKNGLILDVDEDVLYHMPVEVANSSIKTAEIATFFKNKIQKLK